MCPAGEELGGVPSKPDARVVGQFRNDVSHVQPCETYTAYGTV